MHVTEITVSAGRTFNHPYETYSNLKPMVTMRATLDEGDDPEKAVQVLQAKAEKLVEDHKANMLKALGDLAHLQEAQARISSLGDAICRNQEELDHLRQKWPQLPCWLSLPRPDAKED